MKYEEIKVGEVYKVGDYTEKVIEKNDEHKAVMTIDEDGEFLAWSENQLESFQPIKKELPESGLLVCTDGSLIFITGEQSGYGFDVFDIFHRVCRSFVSCPENWRTATPEEEARFIELLKAEAEKRGLGVDAKIKGHADNTLRYPMNDGKWNAMFNLTSGNNKNGRIFHNGIWAEPLTMLDEVTEVIKKHLPNIVVEQVDGVVTLKQL